MKQSSTSVVVMSDAERRERLRNRIYAVFPVVSVLLLILLWFLAAGAENSTFPSPVDIWNRFLLLMEKTDQAAQPLWPHLGQPSARIYCPGLCLAAWDLFRHSDRLEQEGQRTTGAPLYRLSLRAAPGLGAIDDHVVWHR